MAAKTKVCTACDARKPLDDFYANQGKCKRCFLDQQKAAKLARQGAAAAPAKRAAKSAVAQRVSEALNEFLIPAAGAISCRVIDDGEGGRAFAFEQFGKRIECTPGQLASLVQWGSDQLKARG